MKTLFVKYTTQRLEKFQIVTKIYRKDDGVLIVKKEAIQDCGETHVHCLVENAERLRDWQKVLEIPSCEFVEGSFQSAFIEGTSLGEEMLGHLANRRNAAFEDSLKKYASLLRALPSSICDPAENPEFAALFPSPHRFFPCLTLGHVDLLPENIIRTPDGRLFTIDFEWILPYPIPVDFVLYRAVVVLLNRYDAQISPIYSLEEVLAQVGIDEDADLFREWENHFSVYVHGGEEYNFRRKYLKIVQEYSEWSRHLPNTIQSTLFFNSVPEFESTRSLVSDLSGNRAQTVRFTLPTSQRIRYLRWDPCEGIHALLKQCSIVLRHHRLVVASLSEFTTNGIPWDSDTLFMNGDPQVIFALDAEHEVDEIEIVARIRFLDYHELTGILEPFIRRYVSNEKRNIELDQRNFELDQRNFELGKAHGNLLNELSNREMEAERLKYRNGELTQALLLIDRSRLWRLGAPIRGLRRAIRSLRNPLDSFKPIQVKPFHLIEESFDGFFKTSGEDPQLMTDFAPRRGFYLLHWEGSASSRTLLTLYPDHGSGFTEAECRPLGYLDLQNGSHERFLRFYRNSGFLRMDSGETGGTRIRLDKFWYIRIRPIAMVRIGLSLLANRMGIGRRTLLLKLALELLQGRRHQVKHLFASAFRDFGEGSISVQGDDEAYRQYIRDCEPDEACLNEQIRSSADFAYCPLISLVVPVFNTNPEMLTAMIDSVIHQTYSRWELCIADGSTTKEPVASVLDKYALLDERIHIRLLPENLGISGNSNAALALASGDYIALLDHDDLLARCALFTVVETLNGAIRPDIVYSDEDKITADGKIRFFPHFKPDWNPDLLRSYNYITHLFVVSRDILDSTGGFREGFDGSQDHDLILRATELAESVVHIPRILYHWRSHANSTALSQTNKSYTLEAGARAISDHLARIGRKGMVAYRKEFGFYEIDYELERHPLVSIIIPNHEHLEDLRTCIDSIRNHSTYREIEILIIENNSKSAGIHSYYGELEKSGTARILSWNHPFNYAAINNFAAENSNGEFLLFLNNDTEAISPDWMERMLVHAVQEVVGCVGARLYYANDTIQHAGVILGFQGVAGHAFSRLPKGAPGYMARAMVVQDVTAVTAACMMMRRSIFNTVGGFDENLAVAFNDIDLCMKLRARNLLVVYEPRAELYHHESITRGAEDTQEKVVRFSSEVEYFKRKWHDQLAAGDPNYNPHLDHMNIPYRISGK